MKEIKIYNAKGEVSTISVDKLPPFELGAKGLECKLADGTTGLIPLTIDGKRNPDITTILEYAKEEKAKKEAAATKETEKEAPAEEIEVPEEAAEEHEGFVAVDGTSEVREDLKEKAEKKGLLQRAKETVAKHWKKVLALALIAGIGIAAFHSCSNQNIKEEEPTSIEQLQEDSVYTEITEEQLVQTTNDFKNILAENGIEISGQDALRFVTLANISHLQNTNPELLNEVLATVPNAETLISSAGSVIGKIVTSEITADNKDASYWTIAIIDESDRAIAEDGMDLIEDCKEIVARNKAGEIGHEEATLQIKMLIAENFIAPNFDNSIAYTIEGENGEITYSKDTQTPGANFMTDAIVTGILMGDQDLKDHVNAPGYIKVTSADGQSYDIMSYVSFMSENSSSEIKDDTIPTVEATTGDVVGEEQSKYSFELIQYDDKTWNEIVAPYQEENPNFIPTKSEATKDLLVISANKANVSTLHAIINGCIENMQNQNTQDANVKTK